MAGKATRRKRKRGENDGENEGENGVKARVARCLLAILVLLLAVSGRADERTLIVAYVDFPPYIYQNEAGEADGTFTNLTRQVAAEAGYRLEFQLLPAARAYYYLTTGQVDLWLGLVNNPSLNSLVVESQARPIHTEFGVWYLRDTPVPRHFDDLSGKQLITIGGYNYEGLAQLLERTPAITAVSTSNHRSALDMLVRGRGDYLLDYRDPVEVELQTFPVASIRYTPMRGREAAWLFPLAAGGADARVRAFDQAWQRLLDRGEVTAPAGAGTATLMPGLPRLQP